MKRIAFILFGFVTAITTIARADEFHHNNALIGDRAAGLAGAYVALSDDASGLYYNPAGIVFTKGRNISASVNTYNTSKTEYVSAIGDTDWERTSSTLLPNFFGYIQTYGRGVFGFSYAIPDSIEENQNQQYGGFPSDTPGVNVDNYVINYKNTDQTLLFGPSYALEINPQLAIGATLYIHVRDRETINNQLVQLSNSTDQWYNQYYRTSETGLRPIIGILWSPIEQFSFGATLSTTFIVSASNEVQTTNKAAGSSTTTFSNTSYDEKRDMPVTLALGAAWFPTSSLLYSFDLTYHSATQDSTVTRDAVINLAMGVEYYPTSRWAIRGGFFTDFAATPDIDPAQTNQLEHVDIYGLSASITRFTSGASITVGATYAQGQGESQLFSNNTTIVTENRQSLTLFLSTSTTY